MQDLKCQRVSFSMYNYSINYRCTTTPVRIQALNQELVTPRQSTPEYVTLILLVTFKRCSNNLAKLL